MTTELSEAEINKAISEEADDDDFKDAVEDEEIGGEGTFQVTAEELSIIRAELACEFPDDYNYLSDAYVLSVASKPYSKDPSVRRPLEVRERNIRLLVEKSITKDCHLLVDKIARDVPMTVKLIMHLLRHSYEYRFLVLTMISCTFSFFVHFFLYSIPWKNLVM
jgi:hypothetical protein